MSIPDRIVGSNKFGPVLFKPFIGDEAFGLKGGLDPKKFSDADFSSLFFFLFFNFRLCLLLA